jgi:hypothetical protein
MGGGRAEGGTARADAGFDRDRVGAAQLGLEPTYTATEATTNLRTRQWK